MSSAAPTDEETLPAVRFREDVEGCGCVRCQEVRYERLGRSLGDVVRWSGRLPVDRPSVLAVVVGLGVLQVAVLLAAPDRLPVVVAAALLAAFVGRGYVAVVGRAALAGRRVRPGAALLAVGRRLPAFLGAAAAILASLVALVFAVTGPLSGPLRAALGAVGVGPAGAELLAVLGLAACFLYALFKFCFVPEACFVGGYGPLSALRVSWRLTTLHRRKAAAIVGGLFVLFALGAALDTRLAGPESPVAVAFRYGETAVVLRSFGVSAGSAVRFAFDLFVTAAYSGAFVHQYVRGVLETRG